MKLFFQSLPPFSMTQEARAKAAAEEEAKVRVVAEARAKAQVQKAGFVFLLPCPRCVEGPARRGLSTASSKE